MQEPHEDYIGLYGNVRIPKSYCQSCGGYAFVLDGELACCGTPHIPKPVRWKRESPPPDKRKMLNSIEQKLILETQNYNCFWCDRSFGIAVKLGRRQRVLKIHWDHMIPWAYDQNDSVSNFVAACSVCNMWKSSLVFQTIEQCRIYLKGKWDEAQNTENEAVGPEDVPEVPSRVCSEEEVAEVLLKQVSMASVERPKPPREGGRFAVSCDGCGQRFYPRNMKRRYCSQSCARRCERERARLRSRLSS